MQNTYHADLLGISAHLADLKDGGSTDGTGGRLGNGVDGLGVGGSVVKLTGRGDVRGKLRVISVSELEEVGVLYRYVAKRKEKMGVRSRAVERGLHKQKNMGGGTIHTNAKTLTYSSPKSWRSA